MLLRLIQLWVQSYYFPLHLGTVLLIPTTSGVGNELPRLARIEQVLLAMTKFHIYTSLTILI